MALELNPGHTALLAMDFENDIVHEEGAFKDFGFAQMVKDNDVLGKTAGLLTAARKRWHPGHLRLGQVPPRLPGAPGQRRPVAGTPRRQRPHRRHLGRVHPRRSSPAGRRAGGHQARRLGLHGLGPGAHPEEQAHRHAAVGWRRHQLVVEGTAREASDRGYNVVIVGDCCASVNQEAHDASLTVALPFLSTISNSEEVTAALGRL